MLDTNKNWGRGELHSNLFESVFVQCGQAFNLNAGPGERGAIQQ